MHEHHKPSRTVFSLEVLLCVIICGMVWFYSANIAPEKRAEQEQTRMEQLPDYRPAPSSAGSRAAWEQEHGAQPVYCPEGFVQTEQGGCVHKPQDGKSMYYLEHR